MSSSIASSSSSAVGGGGSSSSRQPPQKIDEKQKIAELDYLVDGYLKFRDCPDATKAFAAQRKPHVMQKVKKVKKPPVADRILAAFDDGDYPLLLSLWETFIVQQALDFVPPDLEGSRKTAEFLCNLHCAIYPFRSEIMRRAGAPDVAAKVAARSMTIFKHFVETRGVHLIDKGHDLYKFRSVYKIAFPPTHPKCKELFSQSWVPRIRAEVQSFLDKFLSTSPYDHLPALYKIFLSDTVKASPLSPSGTGLAATSSSTASASALSPTTGPGPESADLDITVGAYKEREEKLVRFSQAIVDITSDLLRVIEAGDPLDNEFLTNFKEKFNYFRNALPAGSQSPQYKVSTQSPPTDGNATSADPKPTRQKVIKRKPSVAVEEKEKRPKEIEASALKFDEITSDLHSKIHEVENFLIESVNPDRRSGDSGNGSGRGDDTEPDKSVKMRYAITSAMQASLLACNLAHLVVRPDKDIQPKAARDAAVSGLVLCDILGIVGPHGSAALPEDSAKPSNEEHSAAESPERAVRGLESTGAKDGTGTAQLGSRLRNEGVLGYIEALRCYLRKVNPPARAGDEGGSSGSGDIETVLAAISDRTDEAIGIFEASLCLSESLFRLITAMGSSTVGSNYLQTYGFDLSTQAVKLMAALPSTFSLKQDGSVLLRNNPISSSNLAADAEAADAPVANVSETVSAITASSAVAVTVTATATTALLSSPASAVAAALSSTRLWCQLAVIVLTSNRKNDATAEDVPLNFLSQAQNDRVQTLAIRHGCLEWLSGALGSLLIEILAAAFASNAQVLAAAKGAGSAAIAAAALELDAAQLPSSSRRPSLRAADATGQKALGSFSIVGASSSSSSGGAGVGATPVAAIPQELLTLLDVSLGLLFVSIRSVAAHRILVSTAVVQEKTKALLTALFRLLLLPQITKTQAENILLILNLLFRYEVKIRVIGRNLPELSAHGRNIARGDLKWFPDTQPLTQLVITVVSDAVERAPSSSSSSAAPSASDADFESDLAAVESDILGTVASLQIFVADNAQLTAFLNKPKTRQLSFAAGPPATAGAGAGGGNGSTAASNRALKKVTAYSLQHYVDSSKATAVAAGGGGSGSGADRPGGVKFSDSHL